MAATEEVHVAISAPKLNRSKIKIKGTAPYVQHRFSQKALLKMEAVHRAGSQAKSKKVREPRVPEDDYKAAMYLSKDGWHGIPAACFRNAAIDACRMVGFKMTHAKLSIFIEADGFDKFDGTPLVKIQGEPKMHTALARNDDGSADIRYRPMWEDWSASPMVKWDADQFSATDVANLFARVGAQVGIGEGRAFSKNSAGLGWGHFEVIG